MKTKIKYEKIINRTAIPGAPEFYCSIIELIMNLKEKGDISQSQYKKYNIRDLMLIEGPKPNLSIKRLAKAYGIDIPEGLL